MKKKHQPSVYINNKDILKNKKNTQDFFSVFLKTHEHTSSFEFYRPKKNYPWVQDATTLSFLSSINPHTIRKSHTTLQIFTVQESLLTGWRKHCYKN